MGKQREREKKKGLSKRIITGSFIIECFIKGVWCGLSLYFFFFFFSVFYTVASPFEAVERGPRWRCCRIDLVPTFALRGRRGTVFAGARVMSTSS